MSYKKAMKHARNVRKHKKQRNMYLGFSLLGANERRKTPWFGNWTLTATEQDVKKAYDKYNAETKRLLKLNPNLKLID